jgi:hypothetical protein
VTVFLLLVALISLGLLVGTRLAKPRMSRPSRTSAWYNAREVGWQKRDRRHDGDGDGFAR